MAEVIRQVGLYAQEKGISVSKALGGTRTEIETGVSLGIEASPDDLCRTIEKYMKQGYHRIKCKCKPGMDIDYVQRVRKEFGDIMLMVDANSAYTLEHMDIFKELDKYDLLMIEQPLASDDIIDHRHLQQAMKTRICLDESIHSAEDARKAIELGSCKTINIKVARVGGLTEATLIFMMSAQPTIFPFGAAVCSTRGLPVRSTLPSRPCRITSSLMIFLRLTAIGRTIS